MKRVLIFGATGNTGLCALDSALKKGFNVRVFIRDESKIPSDVKGKVEIVIGNVTNSKAVMQALEGMEGVIVALGTRNDLKATTVLSEGMKNIINGMKAHNVSLVSVCLSAFLFYKPDAVPAIFKDLNEDHQRMFDILKESGLQWIAVLPPHIADTRRSKFVVKHDESAGRAVSKRDLGAFLVECLEQPEHYQRVCGIASAS